MSTVTTTNILNHFMGLLPRRIYPSMFAQQIVSVQPMTLPAGQLFYLDYKYGKLLEYNWKKPGLFDRITFIQIGDLIDITSDIFGTRSDEESIILTREIDVLYPSPIKIIKFVEEFGSALCTVCEKIPEDKPCVYCFAGSSDNSKILVQKTKFKLLCGSKVFYYSFYAETYDWITNNLKKSTAIDKIKLVFKKLDYCL